MEKLFIGYDVGSTGVRAGIFNGVGELLESSSREIRLSKPEPNFAEYSSNEIWKAICEVTKSVLETSKALPEEVAGIGFDATCSLVVVGVNGASVSVNSSGQSDQDVIAWMDHRAIQQTEQINDTNHKMLSYIGGTISPEMQLPKLLWLKENLSEQFQRIEHFFDLPDWLVYRATGATTRSLCSATCKWTYQGSAGTGGEGWNRGFFEAIGLGELGNENFARLGTHFVSPGSPVGEGLSESSAIELGLVAGTPVAASVIDAYAGAIGTIGIQVENETEDHRLALISGTSACHISMTTEAAFVPGVWGPYYSVLKSGLWANEAGQSSAGSLIDRVITGHSSNAELTATEKTAEQSIYATLDELLIMQSGSAQNTHSLTASLHLQPDFHGNRAPLADPSRQGAMVGLTLETNLNELARQYLAALQALAYGTRQILEAFAERGVNIKTLVVSGGLARNQLYLREHADATGCTILVPDQEEPVLLGSAMLGAVAAGGFSSLNEAMSKMSGEGILLKPRGGQVKEFHNAKYKVFLKMQSDFAIYRDLMNYSGA